MANQTDSNVHTPALLSHCPARSARLSSNMRIYGREPIRTAIGRYFPMAKCSRLNRVSLHSTNKEKRQI